MLCIHCQLSLPTGVYIISAVALGKKFLIQQYDSWFFFFFLYTPPPSNVSDRPHMQNLLDQHTRAGWNVSSIIIMPIVWHKMKNKACLCAKYKILKHIQPRSTKLILCKNEPQMAIIMMLFTVTSSTCLDLVQSGAAVTTVMFSLWCWLLLPVALALVLIVQLGNAVNVTELLWNWALS